MWGSYGSSLIKNLHLYTLSVTVLLFVWDGSEV